MCLCVYKKVNLTPIECERFVISASLEEGEDKVETISFSNRTDKIHTELWLVLSRHDHVERRWPVEKSIHVNLIIEGPDDRVTFNELKLVLTFQAEEECVYGHHHGAVLYGRPDRLDRCNFVPTTCVCQLNPIRKAVSSCVITLYFM